MHKCVSCQFVRDMPGACNIEFGLYYCDEDKIKGKDYGHPIKLHYKACSHYKPLVADCEAVVKIRQLYKHYYAIDEAGSVIGSANYKDIALTKAYKHIRDTFLLQKKQLDLFEVGKNEKV
jgi:hypothetical protein